MLNTICRILIFLYSGFLFSAFANPLTLKYRTFQINDGLSENTVQCIIQDCQGYVWMGTKDGLNRFDGSSFKIFRKGGDCTLLDNIIPSLFENKDGIIWVGTEYGLNLLDPITEAFFELEIAIGKAEPIRSRVNSICAQGDNYIWIATHGQGVFKYHIPTKHMTQYKAGGRQSNMFTTNIIWKVYCDKSGVIWLGTQDGISKYNAQTNDFENINSYEGLSTESLTIFEDSRGRLWFGTWSSGLLEYNKNNQQFYSHFAKGESTYITHIRSIYEYSPGELLIGADDGLFWVTFTNEESHAERLDNRPMPYRLSDKNVYCIFEDRDNALWIGTFFGGVNYTCPSDKHFERHLTSDLPSGLKGKAISEMVEDTDGLVWIATEDAGINIYNPKTKSFTYINSETSHPRISYNNVHALLFDDNDLWVGTFSRGIDRINLKTNQVRNYSHVYSDSTSLINDCVFSLYKGDNEVLYVGTSKGLCSYDKYNDTFERIENSLFVYDMVSDRHNNLWIATYGKGLVRYNTKTKMITNIYRNNTSDSTSISSDYVCRLYIDSKDRLWIGTLGGGVSLYNRQSDSFTTYNEDTGIPNSNVMGILDDIHGNIWFSTNQGLVSFNPEKETHTSFTEADGLQSRQFNFRSSMKTRNGELYFGGINGFTMVQPEFNKLTDPKMNTYITDVKVFNRKKITNRSILKQVRQEQKLILDHDQSSFIINFVLVNFIGSDNNQYYYQMEGVDTEWKSLGRSKEVVFVNLPSGTYKFLVRGVNSQGKFADSGDSLVIKIRDPWWWHPLMKLLYCIILVVIIFLYTCYFHRIRKRKEMLKREEFEQQKENELYKSKINFFTNIAHEIKTPISLISAPLELIMQSNQFSGEDLDNLNVIQRNTFRLRSLANELLDFRRMDTNNYPVNFQNHNLNYLIDDLYSRFRLTAKLQNIEITASLPKQDIIAFVDSEIITKVVCNLLTNALKYAKTEIHIELRMEQEQIIILVSDDGPGIPNKYKESIFNPFFRIEDQTYYKDQPKGTGIGLAFVKQLLSLHNATISVLDNTPKGSLFVVKISLVEAVSGNSTSLISPKEIESPHVISNLVSDEVILVVEDNDELRSFLVDNFKKTFSVRFASNAVEAFKVIEQYSIDIIITDLMMDGGDGVILLNKIKGNKDFSHIPVIMLSAKNDDETKIYMLELGVDVFLEKPFSISFLLSQVLRLLKGRKELYDKFSNSPFLSGKSITTNKRDEEFINKLNEEIEKGMSDSSFSIESLTISMSMSRSNLQRKIKALSGMVPTDYIRLIRLKKAALLLQKGDFRVNEVCYIVGFNSPSYFSKCFQKQFGILPKEFLSDIPE